MVCVLYDESCPKRDLTDDGGIEVSCFRVQIRKCVTNVLIRASDTEMY